MENDITNTPCQDIDSLTYSVGYAQAIDKPTHAVNNSTSCTDLIYCTNKNIISNHGVDVTIFKKSRHNIVYGKTNFRVPLPPVYIRQVWSSIYPPWMTDNIDNTDNMKERSKLTKIFYRNGQRKPDREKMLEKATECTNEIPQAEKYYIPKMSTKLEDSHTAPKAYWSILNRLIYNKKIPTIPPLFVDGNFISDFCAKASIFNNYFVSICAPIRNANVLPPFSYKTNTRKSSFQVTESDILSIIKSLESTKAHEYDNLSIRIIKMCRESITLPLKVIFQESLKRRKFPKIWERTNVVPVHKNENRTFVVYYRPITLLSLENF